MRNITTDKRSIIFDDHRAGRISRAACILLGFLFIPVLGDTAARTTPDRFVSSIDLVNDPSFRFCARNSTPKENSAIGLLMERDFLLTKMPTS